MKKNYFMLAAATMLFAACAETDVLVDVSEKESAPQEIGFDAFANKTTRAIDDESDLQENGGFHVWGYKTRGNENPYTVFNATEVYWDEESNPNDWKYDDIQYWDMTADYQFYAVAPNAETAGVTYGITDDKKITITGAQSAESTESYDHLVSAVVSVNAETNTKDAVEFTFSHVMSKISFKLQAAVNEEITVTELFMSGWDNGVGNYTQDATPDWKINSSVPGTTDNILAEDVELTDANVTDIVGSSYIMVPQTIEYVAPSAAGVTPIVEERGLKFNITYTIGTETFKQEGFVKSTQTWSTNTHTTYTIIINPGVIEFAVDEVNGWTLGSGSATIQ